MEVGLRELGLLLRRYKRQMWKGALLGALLLFTLALFRSPSYPSHATFRDLSEKKPGEHSLKSTLSELTGETERQGRAAFSLLHSRAVLEEPICALGLQAKIRPVWWDAPFGRIARNLKTEVLWWIRKPRLPYPGAPRLALRNIDYQGELPLKFEIRFTSSHTFDLYREDELWVEGCSLDARLKTPLFSADLEADHHAFRKKRYTLFLLPIQEAAEQLASSLSIAGDEEDMTLLHLRFNHQDRHFAAEVLNAVLARYEEYLLLVRSKKAQEQLNSLRKRRESALADATGMLRRAAAHASETVGAGHFLDLKGETAFLTKAQGSYEERLLEIDLELKFLDMVKERGSECCNLGSDYPVIGELFAQIHALRQRRDSLHFALRQMGAIDEAAGHHLLELRQLRKEERELEQLIASLGSEETPHLQNALRSCQIESRIVEDRIAYSGDREFQGISLELGEQLYLNYTSKLDEIERNRRNIVQLRRQIDNVDFELSSLSGALGPSALFEERIAEASRIRLALEDEKNRTPKEQERLRDQLALQRGFIAQMVDQHISLLLEHEEAAEEKRVELQRGMLDLLHRDLSLLEKELLSFAQVRAEILGQERLLFQEQLAELRDQSATLPQRWLSEQELDLSLQTSKAIVRSVTELAESKSIANELDYIESGTLDKAVAATIPNQPRLLLLALLGALLGACSVWGVAIFRSMGSGLDLAPPLDDLSS